ncbi:dienelactone hydrolase family protein [Paraurantiacibacter namhicola]|uniref:Dienelactone hydrolase family protein n=1 Tax=Paraurantiacibacter namhicola TaxID=645517 RepID=A0A1C7D4W4_9SPHN|nr:dienelactone hydrolase family protein [Paraurantiacibacter namhicola]ANU06489.1 Dienelactone hydrolase family protein [Paraurantiacibacter namhicola]
MCDQDQMAAMGRVNRRQFGAIGLAGGAAAGLSACTTMDTATSSSLTERQVTFDAPGGRMDGYFVHPRDGAHPGVILWPDIAGIREAKRAMARRLAGEGYAVFVANPYYRSVVGEQFADFETFRAADGFQKVAPWREKNTPEAVMATARAVVDWLDDQERVDFGKGIANQGYCMTGSWTVFTAAARPDRVRAAASFHGGGLVVDGAMSPHRLLSKTDPAAHFQIAIAQDDDAKAPDHDNILQQSLTGAPRMGEVEVFPANHGWTVLDSPAYDRAAAERAWGRMLAIYQRSL